MRQKSELIDLYRKKISHLKKHNKLYFEDSSPIISDKEYDQIKKEIIQLEKKYSYFSKSSLKLRTHLN